MSRERRDADDASTLTRASGRSRIMQTEGALDMDYMGTIRRGWDIAWNNRWLWLLGFLAALGSGAMSTSNFNVNSNDLGGASGGISPQLGAALAGGVLLLVCVFCILGILLWLVSLAVRGGLITAVSDLDKGQRSSFGQAFRQGWRKVLPLAGMTILLFAVLIILIIILAVVFAGTIAGAIAAGSSGDNQGIAAIVGSLGIAVLCLLCLMLPLGIVLSLIYPFAYRGMMLRGLGVMDAIRHGWRVLRENLGHIFLLGLLFFVIGLVVGLVSGAIVGLLGLSTGLISMILNGSQPTTTQMVAAGLGFLVTAIIFAIISAIITAWRSATFTLAYEQWTGKDVLKDTAAPMPPAMPPTMS